jgi:hypothetical protein
LAACGYAKFTGKLGVCFATSGPGAIHLMNGLYDVKIDRAPVLAITGMTYHDLIGTSYLQDMNQDYVLRDVAIYNQRLMACRDFGVPILGRGCGTSLAGQCCISPKSSRWPCASRSTSIRENSLRPDSCRKSPRPWRCPRHWARE